MVAFVCITSVWLIAPRVGMNGFWPFMLLIAVASFGGTALGGLVARRLFGRSSVGTPEDRKATP
jgi:hypothetical protein